jgi:hypothetical protein
VLSATGAPATTGTLDTKPTGAALLGPHKIVVLCLSLIIADKNSPAAGPIQNPVRHSNLHFWRVGDANKFPLYHGFRRDHLMIQTGEYDYK